MRRLIWGICILCLGTTSAFLATARDQNGSLRRIDCASLAIFTPDTTASADEICQSHGGLARSGMPPSRNALVILEKNRPMGEGKGLKTAAVSND